MDRRGGLSRAEDTVMKPPTILLASASPRRRELLRSLGWRVLPCAVAVDERPRAGERPAAYVRRLARAKALAAEAAWAGAGAGAGDHRGAAARGARRGGRRRWPLLAADTTVVVDGELLGKPRSDREAAAMLRRLSGRAHEVWTGVCVLPAWGGRPHARAARTRVWFSRLTAAEIAAYVASGEPRDKAGGYALQGRAAAFIPRIAGSHSNVIGLPLALAREMLAVGGGPRRKPSPRRRPGAPARG